MQKEEVAHNHIVHTVFLTEKECDDGDKADVVNEHLKPVQEEELYLFTPSDFICETWNSTYTAQRNLRLMIGSISNYLIKQKKINPEVRRICEGEKMKEVLLDIYKTWLKGGLIAEHSMRENVMSFLRIHVPIRLHKILFAYGFMTKKNYQEWVQTHKQYLECLPAMENEAPSANSELTLPPWMSPVSPTLAGNVATQTDFQMREVESEVGVGIEALLRTWTDIPTRSLPQHITLRDQTGQVATLKTPGEHGQQLVRLQIYDTKDIVGRDQRTWWKRAKARSQFFVSSNDRKEKLLGEILEHVGIDLKKIPGAVMDVKRYSSDE